VKLNVPYFHDFKEIGGLSTSTPQVDQNDFRQGYQMRCSEGP